LLLRYS